MLVVKKKQKLHLDQLKKPTVKYRQRIMIQYIVAGFTLEEISEKIKVKVVCLKRWLRDPIVSHKLDLEVAKKVDWDASKRRKSNEYVLGNLHQTLADKIASGDLEKMNPKNLMNFIVKFNDEVRTDTPGEYNSKVKHEISLIEDLSNRFKNANSASYDERKLRGEAIIDITPPKSELEPHREEVLNGAMEKESEKSKPDESDRKRKHKKSKIKS